MPAPDAIIKIRLESSQVFPGVSDQDFLSKAREISQSAYSIVLLSGGSLDCSRYSIACWNPFCCIKAKGRAITYETSDKVITWQGDPLEALDKILEKFLPDFPLKAAPFSGGLVGYAAYELKNTIERLPQTAKDDLDLPDMFFFIPSKILVHDRVEKSMTALELGSDLKVLAPDPAYDVCCGDALDLGDISSNFTHNDYLDSVGRVIDYIGEGDIYQANLSQRFCFPFSGNPFLLWEKMFANNPAPFYAFIHAGDHQVMCTSMERFLFKSGSFIETRPIKGTRKRGQSSEEDERMRVELVQSKKEHAELSMIVDLLRNDLSRVCAPKSVAVTEHRRLEAYQNVFHCVSIITGEIAQNTSGGNILRATFPGGSITGCPKIRAMEIIDELEPNVRHVYTGSIGYLGWHDNMDLNIAIRTAIRKGGKAYFSVGGGIVFDSTRQDEYEETLHKARTLFETLKSL